MSRGNRWDKSSILLNSKAGENFAAGLGEAGRGIAKALEKHRKAKQKKEEDEAAAEWITENADKYGMKMDADKAKVAVKAAGGAKYAMPMIISLISNFKQRQYTDEQIAAAQWQNQRAPTVAGQNDALHEQKLTMNDLNIKDLETPFKPEMLTDKDGNKFFTQSKNSAQYVRPDEATTKPNSSIGKLWADADRLEKLGDHEGAKLFRKMARQDAAGAQARPMSATDWLITGNDPKQYQQYLRDLQIANQEPAQETPPKKPSGKLNLGSLTPAQIEEALKGREDYNNGSWRQRG